MSTSLDRRSPGSPLASAHPPGVQDHQATPPPATALAERLGGKLSFYVFTLFASLFLGVLANKYTDQILPWNWGIGDTPLWGAWGFYLLAAVVVVSTVVAQRAQDTKREREDQRRAAAERALIDATDRLQRLVETLPPPTFLSSFAATDNACREVLADVLYARAAGALPPERVKDAIRTVLGGVAELVRIFENAPSEGVYAANLMIFRPAEPLRNLPRAEREHWERSLSFGLSPLSLDLLEGVLELVPELSTTTTRQGNAPDVLEPLRLAVPVRNERRVGHGKRLLWRVLPGAPLAWVRKKWTIYPSQAALLDWCRRKGAFPGHVVEAVRRYFESPAGASVQAFASLPFPPGTGDEPVGVLNVHSTQPGLFSGRDPVRHLFPLLNPILWIIRDLIQLLVEAEDEETRREGVARNLAASSHVHGPGLDDGVGTE
ncbi:MAG: hypothetical protein ACJ8GN_29330 [Longimicrobiaceae bacterium]